MIGLDTNVLVRYVAQDDSKQSPRATALVESLNEDNPGFISLVAIVELVWVIQGCYDATKDDTIAVLERLLRVKTLYVENAEVVLQAVRLYANANADFADCLIERSGNHALCAHTMTFDSKAAQTAGMQLIQ
jgi:predicted nucleic-acid-binding protein